MMAVSPEVKRMVSGTQDFHADPLEAKRAEILESMAEAEREFALLCSHGYESTVRDRLASLGLEKATKQELREIIIKVMDHVGY